jgi:RsmE family RNA methyltransferase
VNLLLLDPGDFIAANRVRLGGRRFAHARDVLRAAPGDRLRVGAIGGLCGEATVLALGPDALELEVELDTDPPDPLPLSLVVALPRPPSLRRVLQGAAGLGVKDIVLLHSSRVEKSFWGSTALVPAQIEEQLRLGLEQGRDTVLPRVELRRRFRPFVEDELPGRLAASRGLVAHPEGASPCPRSPAGPVTLLVGPEGGWTDFEVELLRAQGAEPISLGTRPLRVENAVVALIARLIP